VGEVVDILILEAAIYSIGKAVGLMRKAVRPHRHNPMDRHNPVAHVRSTFFCASLTANPFCTAPLKRGSSDPMVLIIEALPTHTGNFHASMRTKKTFLLRVIWDGEDARILKVNITIIPPDS
jgi:hypothetical protein